MPQVQILSPRLIEKPVTDLVSRRLPRAVFLCPSKACAQNVRKKDRVLIFCARLSEHLAISLDRNSPTYQDLFTESQVAAGAGASLLAGISRPVPDL